MDFNDFEENWKNSEIAQNFIGIYEQHQAILEKEASEVAAVQATESEELEAKMAIAADKRYLDNYLRVRAEVELIEMKKSLNKLAQTAIANGNTKAALMIESTIYDLGIPEENDA